MKLNQIINNISKVLILYSKRYLRGIVDREEKFTKMNRDLTTMEFRAIIIIC